MTDIDFETNFRFLVGIKIHTQEYVRPHIYTHISQKYKYMCTYICMHTCAYKLKVL